MNKKVEIGVLAAGGFGLFSLCFIGFALMSGQPMSEMAVIGPLFPSDESEEGEDGEQVASGEAGASGAEEGEVGLPERRVNAQDIVTANLGVLGGFNMPAPFARADLEQLVDELRNERDGLKEREDAVTEREALVESQIAALDEKAVEIERIKDEIDVQTAALELRALELSRDEEVEAAGADLRYENLATLYSDGDVKQVVGDLTALGPEDAARVLRILEEDRALELLRAMKDPDRQQFIEAWASMQP